MVTPAIPRFFVCFMYCSRLILRQISWYYLMLITEVHHTHVPILYPSKEILCFLSRLHYVHEPTSPHDGLYFVNEYKPAWLVIA